MKFEKVTINGATIYSINGNLVNENTYNRLLEDDNSSSTLSQSIESNDDFDIEDECLCDNCQNIRDLIDDIKEMDDNEAFYLLSGYISCSEEEAYMRGVIDAHDQIGNTLIKIAGKMEDDLDDIQSQLDEENDDGYEE